MSWAHPEGKHGTHRDYARRGGQKQMRQAKAHRGAETEQRRQDELDKLQRLREAGL